MKSFLGTRRKAIWEVSLVFAFGALMTGIFGTVLTLAQTSRTISSEGSIKGIGVGIYWDPACTNGTSSIKWGFLDPGLNKTVTVYIRNEGNVVATISKATENWNPSAASSYMILNWNYAGQTLNLNQVLRIELTLTVAPTISGITSFSFDIKLIATG